MSVARSSSGPHRLVRADAGTGKTYALTVEYLRRLLLGAAPGSLMAASFTRKAAGEILERLLTRLARAAVLPGEAGRLGEDLARDRGEIAVDGGAGGQASTLTGERCRLMLRRLCAELDRVSVSTLDAFFHRMLGCFRLELGLGAPVTVLPQGEPRVVALRAQALDRLLDELGGELGELLDLLDRLSGARPRRAVAGSLDRLLASLYEAYREAPEPEAWNRLPETPGLGPTELEQALARLAELSGRPYRGRLRAGLERNLESARRSDWRGLLERGPAQPLAEDPPRLEFGGQRIPPEVFAAYEPLLAHARAVLIRDLARRTRATHELLAGFHRHFDAVRREQHVLLFSDLAYLLAHQLPALHQAGLLDVYYRLDARVGHLLLDEFQDTSLDQWRVLEPFAEEIWAHRDGSRSFFCVGDPKQAIYGWRGGCAALFGLVERRLGLQGVAVESRRRNFRSSSVLLEAINQVFSRLPGTALQIFAAGGVEATTVREWLAGFDKHEAADPDLPGYVELRSVASARVGEAPAWSDGGEAAEDDFGLRGELEEELGDELATGVSDGLASDLWNDTASGTARDEAPLTSELLDSVAELVGELVRGAPARSIAVLVRTNRRAARVLDALRRRGLQASGEGGGPIVDDPFVTVVLSALLLADHPADSTALFHVSHSPLAESVGLDLDSASAQSVARRIRERLAAEGLAAVVADWARALAPHCDRRAVTRLAQLLDLAEGFESGGPWRPADFAELAAAAAVEEPMLAPVRVMTVHKAKGLEFDAVILCELERRVGLGRGALLYVARPDPTSPPAAVYRSASATVRAASAELREAYEQESARRWWDELSGLYVALTRARHALYLLVDSGSAERRSLPASSWGEILCRTLTGRALASGTAATLYTRGDPQWPHTAARIEKVEAEAPSERRAPRTARDVPGQDLGRRRGRPRPRLVHRQPAEAGQDPSLVDVHELLRSEPAAERLRGTVLHAWLARVGWLEEPGGVPERSTLLAVGRGCAPSAPASWLEERLAELERVLLVEAVRRRLSRPAELERGVELDLWRERRFAVVLGSELWSGVFDRVVVQRRAGVVVGAELIEFKTDRLGTGEVASRVAGHRAQLEAYGRALCALLGLVPDTVRSYLLFLPAGIESEVDEVRLG